MVRFRLSFLALILSLGLGRGLAAQSHLAEGFTACPLAPRWP
jgi:hypothetical protein